MAYYFRAFCTSDSVPTLATVLDWVRERGVAISVDPRDIPEGTATVDWGDKPVRLNYEEKREPFRAELNRNTGGESLAGQEINEFLGMLEEMKKGRKRDRIIDHLRSTKYVVVCEIPTGDINDAGFHAVDVFLAYFMVNHGGLIQADGQGFYENGKLSVELAA